MGLFVRIKGNGVLSRAIVVALILMSLSFAGTAYYHYNTNATKGYLCTNGTISGCNPMSSDERNEMFMSEGKKYKSIYLDRLLIDGASMHISESYLQSKYPDIFIDSDTSYINMLGTDQQVAIKKRMKQQSWDYHSEVLSMKSEIDEFYELRYIEEALLFASKWTLLLPLSLATLLCIVLGIKNYILHGRVKTAS